MIKGILIGVGLTLLSFFVTWLLRKGNRPSLWTYIVVAIASVALSIEGIHMNVTVKAKRHSNDTFAIVQAAMQTFLPSQAKNYTITLEQASALKFGLNKLLPDVSKSVSISDIANKTVSEASDAICLAIEERTKDKVRKSILLLTVSTIVLAIVMYFTFSISSKRYSRMSNGSRANRRTHRSRRVSSRSRH